MDTELKERIIPSWNMVWDTSKKYETDLRTAAFIGSLERISNTIKVRT